MKTRNLRLDGRFILRSPLSHIGETISSTAHLVRESVIQPDGTAEPIVCYSGNAWRGQLRDLMAAYMLDGLGRPAIGLDAFHLLFSGGRIGGSQTTDIEQARRMRRTIPMLALLGGGVGNQILEGKIKVANCYPVCREAMPVLPRALRADAGRIEHADLTIWKEHSRRDDAKIESVAGYLDAPADGALPLEGGGARPKRAKEKGEVADQMRMRVELVAPGATLTTRITLLDVSDVDLGCLVSGLHRFSRAPFIGGQSARGYGEVDLDYAIHDLDTGEAADFLSVSDEGSLLAPPAAAAKDAYDQHLRTLYDEALSDKRSTIAGMIAA